MNNEFHVMMAATKNYIVHCIEAVHSLHICCPTEKIIAHLIVDCNEDDINIIKQKVNFLDNVHINVYSSNIMDNVFINGIAGSMHLTKMTYARLLAHRYLDHAINRFLWIDCDVLFCSSKALNWLISPFEDNYCIAVKDMSVISFDRPEVTNTQNLNYANAGIMAFDFRAMQEDYVFNSIENFLKNPPKWYIDKNIADETIINLFLKNKIKFIDGIYNIQSILLGYPQYDQFALDCGYCNQIEMIQHCVASHMMGAKPWEDTWNTWQAWQIPLKQWQKQLYDQNCQQLVDKYGEKYIVLKELV